VEAIAIALPIQAKGHEAVCASFIAEGAIAGSFETSTYQKAPDKKIVAESVTLLSGDFDKAALDRGLNRGTILGEAINAARRMALTPSNDMTPTHMADEARKRQKSPGSTSRSTTKRGPAKKAWVRFSPSRPEARSRRSSSC